MKKVYIWEPLFFILLGGFMFVLGINLLIKRGKDK